MNERAVCKVSNVSLHQARTYYCKKKYGRAFAHYLVYLELKRSERYSIFQEFKSVLNAWTKVLEKNKQYEDLFKCYEQAYCYFPNNLEIINSFGMHLLKLEYFASSKNIFELALSYDKYNLTAEHCLSAVNNNLIAQWHFRMLNDYNRNSLFKNAIRKKIRQGYNTVLDIGTGTALLSLFASSEIDIKSITACESSECMIEIAEEVLETNRIGNVKLINKLSNNLRVPDDLPERANLLITETFDCGLFGEGILATLIHAWDNLLVSDAKVIPANAELFITGVQCKEIQRKHHLIKNDKLPLNLNKVCLVFGGDEPYDSEMLQTKDVKYLTDAKKGLDVNFSDVAQLRKYFGHTDDVYDENPVADNETIVLNCLESGELHAFAVWFKLNVDDDTHLNTSPFETEKSCWEQAIFYLNHPVYLKQRQTVEVQFSCTQGALKVNILNYKQNCGNCIGVGQDFIYFLNDSQLMEHFEATANELINGTTSGKIVNVLDAAPFPLIGLYMVKYRGAKCTVVVESCRNKIALEAICKLNDINVNRISFVLFEQIEEYIELICDKNTFDYMIIYPFTTIGVIEEIYLLFYENLKACLKKDGIILPKTVTMYVEVLDSEYLNEVNRVDDKNTCDFKIAESINKFQRIEYWDLDVDVTNDKISEKIKLDNILIDDSNPIHKQHTITLTRTGTANALLYWFELEWLNDKKTNTLFDNVCNFNYNTCFLLENPIYGKVNDTLIVKFKQHKGFFKLYV